MTIDLTRLILMVCTVSTLACSGDKKDKNKLDDRFAAMLKTKPCKTDKDCLKAISVRIQAVSKASGQQQS